MDDNYGASADLSSRPAASQTDCYCTLPLGVSVASTAAYIQADTRSELQSARTALFGSEAGGCVVSSTGC